MTSHKPVFSLLTPLSEGGISIFALSGDDAEARLNESFKGKRRIPDATPGDLLYGVLHDESGRAIDEVIVAKLSPAEFELGSHGGAVAAHEVAARLTGLGFRAADAREFSRDLISRGRSGLLREAVMTALAEARTGHQVEIICSAASHMGQGIAACLNGPDASLADGIAPMLTGAEAAQAAAGVSTVTLIGPTNSGKSTLANALGGDERHIVSAEPGTTRDVIERVIDLGGLAITLRDTAGALESPGELGDDGWRRAAEAASESELTLLVVDGSTYPTPHDRRIAGLVPKATLVLNKCDLGRSPEAASSEGFAVSALTGEGLGELAAGIAHELLGGEEPGLAFDKGLHSALSSSLEAARAGDFERARSGLAGIVGSGIKLES